MALSAPFSVLLGFSWWALLGPSRRLPRLLPFGLSSVGPCGLPVALCPCSAFPLACGLLCVLLAALARFGFRVFRLISGNAGRTTKKIRAPQLRLRESLPHGFRSPHSDELISQLFLLKSAVCRFLRNLQKFAYSTIRSTICLVFSGLRSLPICSLPLVVWSLLSRPSSVLTRSRERHHRFWGQDIPSRSRQTPRQSWMPQSAQRSLLSTTEFQKLDGFMTPDEKCPVTSTQLVDSCPVVSFSRTFLWSTLRLKVFLRLSSTVCVRFAQHTSSQLPLLFFSLCRRCLRFPLLHALPLTR